MSDTVNYRRLFPAALPLLVLAAAVGAAVWFGMESEKLPRPLSLHLHPALEMLPAEESEHPDDTAKAIARELFYRPAEVTEEKTEEEPQQLDRHVRLTEVTLSSIAEGGNGTFCIVNGDFYLEGTGSDLFTVRRIDTDRVEFTSGETTFTLRPGEKYLVESHPAGSGESPPEKQILPRHPDTPKRER